MSGGGSSNLGGRPISLYTILSRGFDPTIESILNDICFMLAMSYSRLPRYGFNDNSKVQAEAIEVAEPPPRAHNRLHT